MAAPRTSGAAPTVPPVDLTISSPYSRSLSDSSSICCFILRPASVSDLASNESQPMRRESPVTAPPRIWPAVRPMARNTLYRLCCCRGDTPPSAGADRLKSSSSASAFSDFLASLAALARASALLPSMLSKTLVMSGDNLARGLVSPKLTNDS